MSYYATLAERGFFPASLLATYAQNGGTLPEHPTPGGIPGVRVATGSLGHGLADRRRHGARARRSTIDLVASSPC